MCSPRAERHAGLIEDDVLTDSRPKVYIHNSRPGTRTYKNTCIHHTNSRRFALRFIFGFISVLWFESRMGSAVYVIHHFLHNHHCSRNPVHREYFTEGLVSLSIDNSTGTQKYAFLYPNDILKSFLIILRSYKSFLVSNFLGHSKQFGSEDSERRSLDMTRP